MEGHYGGGDVQSQLSKLGAERGYTRSNWRDDAARTEMMVTTLFVF
jgi:hypothetical protein